MVPAGFKVKCPKCGNIYEPYTDFYVYFHDCPKCGFDDFVRECDEIQEEDDEE